MVSYTCCFMIRQNNIKTPANCQGDIYSCLRSYYSKGYTLLPLETALCILNFSHSQLWLNHQQRLKGGVWRPFIELYNKNIDRLNLLVDWWQITKSIIKCYLFIVESTVSSCPLEFTVYYGKTSSNLYTYYHLDGKCSWMTWVGSVGFYLITINNN